MSGELEDLLSDEEIASIRLPIEQAKTLPSRCFTDPSFYELEVRDIYCKHWVAVVFAFELANPGDVLPFELCELPLVAVRGDDDEIRVFHNICPYDGCPVVIDPGKQLASLEVPYHGWTYDLRGKLVKTPYWDGTTEGGHNTLGEREVDLVEVHSTTFMHTVFVNLSSSPVAFDTFVAPLFCAMQEYDLENSQPGLDESNEIHVRSDTIRTNWKTHLENACVNVLHEHFVHAGYRKSPEVPRIREDGVPSFNSIVDENFMALGYRRKDFEQTYPPLEIPHLGRDPSKQPLNETFGTLYPNFYVSASSQFIEVGIALPGGPGITEQKVCYLYEEEVARSTDALPLRCLVAEEFFAAAQEDARICEAIQRARKSPVYEQKFYSPFWDQMHYYFTNLILDDLEVS